MCYEVGHRVIAYGESFDVIWKTQFLANGFCIFVFSIHLIIAWTVQMSFYEVFQSRNYKNANFFPPMTISYKHRIAIILETWNIEKLRIELLELLVILMERIEK